MKNNLTAMGLLTQRTITLKGLFLILFILFGRPAFCQYNFKVNIATHSLSEKKLYVCVFGNDDHTIPLSKDSVIFKNGHATINGRMTQPSSFASFSVAGANGAAATCLIDSGINHINIELPSEQSKILTTTSDVRGGRIYEEMKQIFLNDVDHYPKLTSINGSYNIPFDLLEQIREHQLKRLLSYPNDYGGLVCLHIVSRWSARPEDAKKVLATLSVFNDSLKNSVLGKQLYKEETDIINNK